MQGFSGKYMLIGIIGAPNKGKSTLFSALTLNDVEIADYPFTTIDPNFGIAYASKTCIEKKLNTKCNARNSLCIEGTRMLPINVIDVAGLVEGAHEGRGMGNQFLNDLAGADALMLVVDASGHTDKEGNSAQDSNPVDDVAIIVDELAQWLCGILKKHMNQLSKSKNGVEALEAVLTGLKIKKADIEYALQKCSLTSTNISWSDADTLAFAKEILAKSKPLVIIANKADAPGSAARISALREKFGASNVFACSAAIEMALRKADVGKAISYKQGSTSFEIKNPNISNEQRNALQYMQRFLASNDHGTGVQDALNTIVFKIMDNIVAYPVEDENKYTDHFGNVLPDAILLKRGSTVLDLAENIHTELANHMLYAIDAMKKIRISKEQVLNDDDVVKIVSAAK